MKDTNVPVEEPTIEDFRKARQMLDEAVPVEKPDWLKKESVLQAGMEGALLQRIQMAVWEYMDQEVGERDGIKLAESIVEDVKKTCLSQAIQAARIEAVEEYKSKNGM